MNQLSRLRTLVREALTATHLLAAAHWLRGRVFPVNSTLSLPVDSALDPVIVVPAANEAPTAVVQTDYDARVQAEIATFVNDEVVHNLPEIFHYWSNKYLLPKIQPFGFNHPDDFFVKQLVAVMQRIPSPNYRFVSVGAGNCDTEVRVAQSLLQLGYSNFTIECLDLNETMLERGRALARDAQCTAQVVPLQADFNRWRPESAFHAVIANQSLHHVMNLEGLFDAIDAAIRPLDSALITSDMIGRNGHQRWPEALLIVEDIWRSLPERYKYNHQLKRVDHEFVNWDCSTDGFEGIRAQDILPMLIERFNFELFVPFSNVVSPFLDRSYGHNFDSSSESDRSRIDEIHARDEAGMVNGTLKPTQMFAVLGTSHERKTRHPEGMSPTQCVRNP
jgi:SAM-dependent methyltransferase